MSSSFHFVTTILMMIIPAHKECVCVGGRGRGGGVGMGGGGVVVSIHL